MKTNSNPEWDKAFHNKYETDKYDFHVDDTTGNMFRVKKSGVATMIPVNLNMLTDYDKQLVESTKPKKFRSGGLVNSGNSLTYQSEQLDRPHVFTSVNNSNSMSYNTGGAIATTVDTRNQMRNAQRRLAEGGDIEDRFFPNTGSLVVPKPTVGDSAGLLNNAIQLNNFYSKERGYEKMGSTSKVFGFYNKEEDPYMNELQFGSYNDTKKRLFKDIKELAKKDLEQANGLVQTYPETYPNLPSFYNSLLTGVKNTKNINPYSYQVQDNIAGAVDWTAPPNRTDWRIKPSSQTSYMSNGPGALTDIYTYDPQEIKPWFMRTPAEKVAFAKRHPNQNKDTAKPVVNNQTDTAKPRQRTQTDTAKPVVAATTPVTTPVTKAVEKQVETPPVETPKVSMPTGPTKYETQSGAGVPYYFVDKQPTTKQYYDSSKATRINRETGLAYAEGGETDINTASPSNTNDATHQYFTDPSKFMMAQKKYNDSMDVHLQYKNKVQPKYDMVFPKDREKERLEKEKLVNEATKLFHSSRNVFDMLYNQQRDKYGIKRTGDKVDQSPENKEKIKLYGDAMMKTASDQYKKWEKDFQYKEKTNKIYDRTAYLDGFREPSAKLNDYYFTEKDKNFEVKGMKPVSWDKSDQGGYMYGYDTHNDPTYGTSRTRDTESDTGTRYEDVRYSPRFKKPSWVPYLVSPDVQQTQKQTDSAKPIAYAPQVTKDLKNGVYETRTHKGWVSPSGDTEYRYTDPSGKASFLSKQQFEAESKGKQIGTYYDGGEVDQEQDPNKVSAPKINMSLMGQANFQSESVQNQAPASKYKAAEQNKVASKGYTKDEMVAMKKQWKKEEDAENLRKATVAAERELRIAKSNVANNESLIGNPDWRNVLADQTQATGDKLRISNEENLFDDYINPAAWIGNMATNLGKSPQTAEQTDSFVPYLKAFGEPLVMGALGELIPKTKIKTKSVVLDDMAKYEADSEIEDIVERNLRPDEKPFTFSNEPGAKRFVENEAFEQSQKQAEELFIKEEAAKFAESKIKRDAVLEYNRLHPDYENIVPPLYDQKLFKHYLLKFSEVADKNVTVGFGGMPGPVWQNTESEKTPQVENKTNVESVEKAPVQDNNVKYRKTVSNLEKTMQHFDNPKPESTVKSDTANTVKSNVSKTEDINANQKESLLGKYHTTKSGAGETYYWYTDNTGRTGAVEKDTYDKQTMGKGYADGGHLRPLNFDRDAKYERKGDKMLSIYTGMTNEPSGEKSDYVDDTHQNVYARIKRGNGKNYYDGGETGDKSSGPVWQDQGSKNLKIEIPKTGVIDRSLMGTPNFASETVQSQAPMSKYAAAEQNKAAVKTAIEGRAEKAYNKNLQRQELKKKYPTKNQEEIQRIQDKIESPLFYEPAGQLASYATRFHGLTDDEIASITGSGTMGDRLGVAANMGAWALANEVGGKAIGNFVSNVSPYVKKGLGYVGGKLNKFMPNKVPGSPNAYKGAFADTPKPTKEALEDAKGFLKRRTFIKKLQEEKLIGKEFDDLNYAARSTDKTNALTKLALNKQATRYRGVEGEVPKNGIARQESHPYQEYDMSKPALGNNISEFENMKNAGVDFNDPISIAKYQATHIPMEQYGYRSGMPYMRHLDALYAGKSPTGYGKYQIKMTSPRDYSQGNYMDWVKKYHNPENNLQNLAVKDGSYISDFVPSTSYEMPIGLNKTNLTTVVGKRGQKMFDVDESFPFMDYKNLTNDQILEFNNYEKNIINEYNTGWKGKYKNGGLIPAALNQKKQGKEGEYNNYYKNVKEVKRYQQGGVVKKSERKLDNYSTFP